MSYRCPQCNGVHPNCPGHAEGDPCPACAADNEFRARKGRTADELGGMFKVGVRP